MIAILGGVGRLATAPWREGSQPFFSPHPFPASCPIAPSPPPRDPYPHPLFRRFRG